MGIIKDFFLQLAFISTLIFTFQLVYAGRSEKESRIKFILLVLLGLSILLCMSFPAYTSSNSRLDIRIVPLLLGTLYGGWRTGIFLSVLIILFRYSFGSDLGLYTTILSLLLSMPVIIHFQKRFIEAKKAKRLQLALILTVFYCLIGITSATILRGFTFQYLQVQLINLTISTAAVFFFTFLNETIRDMIRKNEQLQAAAKDAEIAFLRSQIKPHFLYNTLNSIAVLCIKEPRRAEELTLEFAQYLRRSFDFKPLDSMTTLENELELVNVYLNIEKARFGARLHAEFEVDADRDTPIPPLVLQPLVENAVKHGLMSNLQGGTVKISITNQTKPFVSFVIEDNGCGMSETQLDQILKPENGKRGVGLWNINQRIAHLYGNGLRIESDEGKGTKIYFQIHVQPSKQIGG